MRKKLLGLAALLVAGATASYADTITLVGPIPSHTYQQGTNSPCVIGNSSCQNPANFGYTEIKANPGSYNMVQSPIYTVSQIESIVGSNAFWVGIDINQTNVDQTLDYFAMTVAGDVQAFSSTPPTSVPAISNGNGYADWLLEGFNLANYAGTDSVQFTMNMPLADDGAEQFFLIGAESTPPPPPPPPPSVPEPGTFALLGSGLVSMAGLLARRKAV